MKKPRRYKITIEDESHLQTLFSLQMKSVWTWLSVIGIIILVFVIAGAIISFTPLRNLLPGYMKESERSATQDGLLKLDSLQNIYNYNQAYIENILRITNINRTPSDSASSGTPAVELSVDSLLGPTVNEQRFVSTMEERERFNISVLAPLAADGMMFSPVSPDAIFTNDSRTREEGILLLPHEESLRSVADGSVIAVYYSPSDHGYVVVIQHPRGFVSSYIKTGTPLVGIGDVVTGGQMIALSPKASTTGARTISLRMWHNGSPIVPYEYVNMEDSPKVTAPGYESPRGKF